MVERNLAKVEVAGPSPVSRSKSKMLEYAPLLQYLSGSGVFVLNENINTGAVAHPAKRDALKEALDLARKLR